MGCCASTAAGTAEKLKHRASSLIDEKMHGIDEKREAALDAKIAADESIFDAAVLADRAYLRAMSGALHKAISVYEYWGKANVTQELYLPHLVFLTKAETFVGTLEDGEKLRTIAAKVAEIAALEKTFHSGAATQFFEMLKSAATKCDGGLPSCKAYIQSVLDLQAVTKQMTDAEAVGKPYLQADAKIKQAKEDVALRKSNAETHAPMEIDNVLQLLCKAFTLLRNGHATFHSAVMKVNELPQEKIEAYRPKDTASNVTEWALDLGLQVSALKSGIGAMVKEKLAGSTDPFAKTVMESLIASQKEVRLTVKNLEDWKATVATPSKGVNTHAPNGEEEAVEALASSVKDAVTKERISYASFPKHDEEKETMRKAIEEFQESLNIFSKRGIGVAMDEVSAYNEAERKSSSMNKKLDKMSSDPSKMPTSEQKQELYEALKATAIAKCRLANTMLALKGLPATETAQFPELATLLPTMSKPVEQPAPQDEPKEAPKEAPKEEEEPKEAPKEEEPKEASKEEQSPAPSAPPSPPAEEIQNGDIVPAVEVESVSKFTVAAEAFLEALVGYCTSRPINPLANTSPDKYERGASEGGPSYDTNFPEKV